MSTANPSSFHPHPPVTLTVTYCLSLYTHFPGIISFAQKGGTRPPLLPRLDMSWIINKFLARVLCPALRGLLRPLERRRSVVLVCKSEQISWDSPIKSLNLTWNRSGMDGWINEDPIPWISVRSENVWVVNMRD